MDCLVTNASKALWEQFMQKHTENLPPVPQQRSLVVNIRCVTVIRVWSCNHHAMRAFSKPNNHSRKVMVGSLYNHT